MHQTPEVQSDGIEMDGHEYSKMYKTSELLGMFTLLAGDGEVQKDGSSSDDYNGGGARLKGGGSIHGNENWD